MSYTPTTEQIRKSYAVSRSQSLDEPLKRAKAFDAWLAAHDAEVAATARVEMANKIMEAAEYVASDHEPWTNADSGFYCKCFEEFEGDEARDIARHIAEKVVDALAFMDVISTSAALAAEKRGA